ncbi:transcriptional regulator domain-containing protein [Sphingopyxis sp. NJF-3]
MPAIETRPVLPRGSWRDPKAYARLENCGARGLAWELTRRNPDYQDAALIERTAFDATDEMPIIAGADFIARWGLLFR